MEYSHAYIAELVKRARTGGSDAFAELYNCTYSKVYNYCRHYMKDDYLAQDAVQEIYISALKNLEKLNDPTLFIAWLNQISFHVCYDMTKKRRQDSGEGDSEIIEQICDVKLDSNPEASAFVKDEQERLRKAVEDLSPVEQQLITLRYYNGMRIDEIVSITGISRSTVKRRIASATDTLRNLMKD